jgi:hypothetical protein
MWARQGLGKIDSARMERLAAQEPAGGPQPPAPETVFEKRQPGVLRTGRSKPAGAREQGREAALVDAEQVHQETGQAAGPRSRRPENSRSSSVRRAGKSLPRASGFR